MADLVSQVDLDSDIGSSLADPMQCDANDAYWRSECSGGIPKTLDVSPAQWITPRVPRSFEEAVAQRLTVNKAKGSKPTLGTGIGRTSCG